MFGESNTVMPGLDGPSLERDFVRQIEARVARPPQRHQAHNRHDWTQEEVDKLPGIAQAGTARHGWDRGAAVGEARGEYKDALKLQRSGKGLERQYVSGCYSALAG
jgi:hypothetical protein